MRYAWKRHPKGAPKASVTGKYLEQLHRQYGGITAERLVIESQPQDALLHSCFEWNSRRAANEYRKDQARALLRCLVVIAEENDDEPVEVHAFVNFPNDPEYRTIATVLSDDDPDQEYKEMLLEELRRSKRKCIAYKEFAEVCRAITRVRIK